jgi:hypothetical protein
MAFASGVPPRYIAMALVFAACSSAATPAGNRPATTAPPAVAASSAPVVIENQGGTLEGHTRRRFAGTGAGLFAGDNLNPNFPDGDGVYLFLTFEVEPPSTVSSAVLASQVLTVRGTPFDDLGTLLAEPVAYDAFGPDLFDLEATGPAVACQRLKESEIVCDITDSVRASAEAGTTPLQYRLGFDRVSDGDGQADLAMFTFGDSNTNAPGIFTLTIES